MDLTNAICHILIILTIFSNYCQFTKGEDENKIVDLGEMGQLKGIKGSSLLTQRSFWQFLGFPYAKTPVGNMRFMPSEPYGPISKQGEIFEATSYSQPCYQYDAMGVDNGVEDCLKMNIFTHQTKESEDQKLKPVLIYTHGGAYQTGSGEKIPPFRLMERDMVFVTYNYRLGSNGFLNLDTDEARGNLGLYDCIEALKFVNKYIHHFGGDPNRVTISGESAGGSLTTHLLINPHAKGLFHGAISSSGTAIAPFGFHKTIDSVKANLDVAEYAGCMNENVNVTIGCLRNVPQDKLKDGVLARNYKELINGVSNFVSVGPSIQSSNIQNPILTESPIDILNKKEQSHVPLMLSASRHEGTFIAIKFYESLFKPFSFENNYMYLRYLFIPMVLEGLGVPKSEHEKVAETYFGDARFSGNWTQLVPGLVDVFSVYAFKKPAYEFSKMHSRVAPTYLSAFEYPGFILPSPSTSIPYGIGHCSDIVYIIIPKFENQEYEQMSKTIVDKWANFVEFGNPNGENSNDWPRFTEENPQFLIIGKESKIGNEYPKMWPNAAAELFN